MYITLETDNAIRIVKCLAQAKARTDAKTLSEQANVSLRFALKILRKLVAGGVIKSYKGSQGGYELLKSDEETTVYDVIKAISGEFCFSRCLQEGYVCEKKTSEPCSYQHVFADISKVVRDKLQAVTFKSLANNKCDECNECE